MTSKLQHFFMLIASREHFCGSRSGSSHILSLDILIFCSKEGFLLASKATAKDTFSLPISGFPG
jgi:hypothetical protein